MRVLIIEDNVRLAQSVQDILKQIWYDSDICTDGITGSYQILEQAYDAVILDVMLPGKDGITLLKEAREQGCKVPVLMLTARSEVEDKVRGLESGADYYLTKPFGIMELISRVKALLRRTSREQSSRVLEIGMVRMDDEKHKVTAAGADCELTFKEYELLKLLMTNAGIVTSREEILEKVWGTNFEGESRTLDMHIKTLRQKLGETGNLIKTVRNVGYIFSA